jgi:hypothetical protein
MNKHVSYTDSVERVVLFEVVMTKVLGKVYHDQYGTMTPYVAAFQLIAECGCDGTFQFPNGDGGMVKVVVETTDHFDKPE